LNESLQLRQDNEAGVPIAEDVGSRASESPVEASDERAYQRVGLVLDRFGPRLAEQTPGGGWKGDLAEAISKAYRKQALEAAELLAAFLNWAALVLHDPVEAA
jgi:hypothetical protein